MTNLSIRVLLFPSACLLAWTLAGCGADGARAFGGDGTGGTAGTDGGAAGEPGTGGVSGSGGVMGTGGIRGSGGVMGTGGQGTGGATAGGHPGSGGAGATGGLKGTGGVVGSGGRQGTGGGMGTGGGGGPDPAKCDQLAADYQKEMPNARMCTLGMAGQCTTKVPGSLGCLASCGTYVQTASILNEIAKRWASEGCDSIARLCPAIACIAPQSGNCAVSGSASTPMCQNSSTTPMTLN